MTQSATTISTAATTAESQLPVRGLTDTEARARHSRGEGNNAGIRPSRTYWDIARANLFTLFNNILFVIGVALIAVGRYNDALTSVGLGLVNALISTVQEIRAKRQLDQISLVSTPRTTVVRDGTPRAIHPSEIVRGDAIALGAGDQVVVDGVVLDGTLEMDESLLTGEPDLIRKQIGDQLFSGSYCVTGTGYMEAVKVGADSYANQVAATARQFQVTTTPLQRQINLIVRVVMLVVVVMSIIIVVASLLEGLTTVRLIQVAAVLSGQVPYGLFLMIVVAYAIGASTIAKQGALVQQVNAVESLSNIDVLCMDKTGTLTANRLRFNKLAPLADVPAEAIAQQLGDYVRSATSSNPTSDAIRAGVEGLPRLPADEIPFASARKWSALAFNHPERRGVYVLGATEMLAPYLPPDALAPDGAIARQTAAWSANGLRVLLFAYNPDAVTLHDAAEQPALPPLTPLALVSLSDELRPNVTETLHAFHDIGLQLKVISGDNPHTVAALAKQAGIPGDLKLVSGPELAAMSSAEFDQAAEEATVFGRITPEQKDQLVDALLRRGQRVAMMGDGVNDVPALKKSTLGIAMQSGSSAARNVADMVLLNDSFGVLQPAFQEGRRIIGGMTNALFLFLARVATTTLIIIAVTMIGLDFPFDPAQVALTTFTVGIPAFFLTLWARPQRLAPNLFTTLARFVFPVAIITMLMAVGLYVADYRFLLDSPLTQLQQGRAAALFESYTGIAFGDSGYSNAVATVLAQGSLSMFISWTAALLILFLEPPHRFFLGWRQEVSADKRPAWLALALFFVFLLIWTVDPIGQYFGILFKPLPIILDVLMLVVVWFFVMRAVWRYHIFERFLGIFVPKK
jgi:cation-transporting P-type ATPase E